MLSILRGIRFTPYDEIDAEFVDSTTCHGAKRFCNTWSSLRRIVWFIIILACLGLLGQQLYDRFQNFLKFEMKTDVQVVMAKELALPAITICNANMFSESQLNDMDADLVKNVFNGTLQELSNFTLQMVDDIDISRKNPDATMTEWNAKWLATVKGYEKIETEILKRHGENPAAFAVDSWIRRTGWKISGENTRGYDPILKCSIGKKICDYKDFKMVNSKEGLCYTFNYNHSQPYIQKIAGTEGGLKLIVDVNQDDYSHYTIDGNYRYGAGVKVILHDWHEIPDPSVAVHVSSGSTGYLAVKKSVRKVENHKPWSSCETGSKAEPYSQRNCLLTCQTEATVKMCGCKLWFQPAGRTSGPQCGVASTLACMFAQELAGEDVIDENCVKSCIDACEQTTFDFGFSNSDLISTKTLSQLQDFLYALTGLPNPPADENNDTVIDSTFIENNIVALEIGYSQLQVQTVSSSPAQTISGFISDIGGQLGLFAGISVVTICEFLEYPIIKLASVLKKKKVTGDFDLEGQSPQTSKAIEAAM